MRKLLCIGLGACLLFALAGCAGARKYTVTFRYGEEVVKTVEAEAGEELDLRYLVAAPEKPSDEKFVYSFSGWSLSEGGETQNTHTVTGDVTFYAQYSATEIAPERPMRTLYLRALGETEQKEVRAGESLSLSAPVLPALVSFQGWYEDEEFTQAATFTQMPDRDVHLFASCALDLPAGELKGEGNFLYGEKSYVRIEGLAESEGLSYAVTWQGAEGEGESACLENAGEYAITAEIKASYLGLAATHTLSGSFTVQKRSLQSFVSVGGPYVYGEEIAPSLHLEGLVHGDSASELGARFVFQKKGTRTVETPLPVGEYTVTAEFSNLENYELVPASPAPFTVEKRPLSATVSVPDLTYGEEPEVQITWSGLIEGESGEGLLGENAFTYLKGGEAHTGKFTPASYTLEVDASALTSQNYALSAVNSCTFRVKKAKLNCTVALAEESIVYGAQPAPALTLEGFVFGESATVSPLFRYRGEKQGDPLPVGTYEVTAEIVPPEHYELGEMTPATLTVQKRQLTPTVTVAEKWVYGQTPSPVLTFSGFAEGEGEEEISGAPNAISFTRNGAPHEGPRFPAGEYTAEADLAKLSAENYAFQASNRAEFTVNKAQGTLDVSGVPREYTYTGGLQRVETGATSNNTEDGVISYTNNAFTTVAEGEALSVTVTLSEGENYTGATETVTGFTVHKQTLTSLPVPLPEIPEQVNRAGRTLKEVSIPDPRFTWKSEDPLVLGQHGYGAVYSGDPDNVLPFETSLPFFTRKEEVALSVSGGEADYVENASPSELTLAQYTLTGEDGAPYPENGSPYVRFTPTASLNLSVGGTYPVSWTFALTENDYFSVHFGNENAKEHTLSGVAPFKWKSVELSGKLYTAEDALFTLLSGERATVKHDTTFSPDFYGEEYYTVKSGACLLVPFGEEDAGETQQLTANRSYEAVAPTGYLTLTLPKGELVVEGKLIVNADRVSNSNQTSNVRGSAYATLSLGKDAQVTVKSGGVFESMGFTCGEGQVTAEAGATVFEPFSMPGWKGGTVSTGIRGTVFPVNQYTASSLIAKTNFAAGSTYSLRVAVTASNSAQNGLINFVGTENALMLLKSGTVSKWVDEKSGKVCFEAAGEVEFGNVSIAVTVGSASTSGLQVPLPGHFSLSLREGSMKIPSTVGLKLLPGAELSTAAGTSFTVEKGGSLYAYGANNYSLSDVSAFEDGNLSSLKGYPNGYVAGCYQKTPALGYTSSTPAKVTVGGTFTAEEGAHVGVTFSGEEGARLSLAEGGVYENVVKEDHSTTSDIGGFMSSLMGTGGKFFQTTFTLAGLSAGNYRYEGGWEAE